MHFCLRIEKGSETLFQALKRDMKSVLVMLPVAIIARSFLIRSNVNAEATNIILLSLIAIPVVIFRVVCELNTKIYYLVRDFKIENLPQFTATEKMVFSFKESIMSNVSLSYGLQVNDFIGLSNNISGRDAKSLFMMHYVERQSNG